MRFENFILYLFLIYVTSFYMVTGQTVNEEKSDCTKYYNFKNGDTKDYGDSCCSDLGIRCNDGYISVITGSGFFKNIDIQSFPYLPKIERLEISASGVKEIPNNIFSLTNLKSLNFHTNSIEVIPSAIQNLTNLESLYLGDNDVKELPNEIFKLTHLELIDLHGNKNLNVKMIKFANSPIKKCDLNNINISCYESQACESIHYNFSYITNAKAESKFKICTKEEIDEILNPKVDNNTDHTNSNHKSNFLYIIVGCIVVILIGILVTFILIKKSKAKKHNKSDSNSDDEFRIGSIKVVLNKNQNNNNDSNDVNVVISSENGNKNDNDNSNDDNTGINNSNNNNNNSNNNNNNNNDNNNNNNVQVVSNDNSKFNINNLKQIDLNKDNLNQNNFNKFIMVDTESGNTYSLPGNIILLNNLQIPGNSNINSISLYNKDNEENKHASMGIQKKLQSYNKNDMIINSTSNNINSVIVNTNNKVLFTSSPDEGDEPPPAYSEINNLKYI